MSTPIKTLNLGRGAALLLRIQKKEAEEKKVGAPESAPASAPEGAVNLEEALSAITVSEAKAAEKLPEGLSEASGGALTSPVKTELVISPTKSVTLSPSKSISEAISPSKTIPVATSPLKSIAVDKSPSKTGLASALEPIGQRKDALVMKGVAGTPVDLAVNYVQIRQLQGRGLYEYTVQFEPNVDEAK